MCGKTKYYGKVTVPGELMNITAPDGTVIAAGWGFVPTQGALQYNVRIEKLTTLQRDHRAILAVDGFFENGKGGRQYYFSMPDGKPTLIAVTYRQRENSYEFCIITRSARIPVIGVHDRQPLLIGDERSWLEKGFIKPPEFMLNREEVA